jgi:ribosomal protein L40E
MKSAAPRKACPRCGHQNRVTAKVCVQCAHAFVLVDADGVVRKTCANCNHANRLTARVCSQCGHHFSSLRPMKRLGSGQKWCPQCGAARKPSAKVCNQCGFRFKPHTTRPPIVGTVEPPVTLPPTFEARAPLPPNRPSVTDSLSGVPSPYLSSDDLNRLRASGPYSPGLMARFLFQLNKKDRS